MRRLQQTLLAGGVVYPAGTREDAIEATVTRDDVWADADELEVDNDLGDFDESHPNTAELKSLVQFLAERHLADVEVPVVDVLREAAVAYDVVPAADERVERALAMLSAAEGVGTGAVEIGGFRIEACDEQGQTPTTIALADAVRQITGGPDTTFAEAVAGQGSDEGKQPAPEDGLAPPYDEATPATLKAEVDRRNEGRDPDGDTFVKVADRRSKDQLVAALQADDAASREG